MQEQHTLTNMGHIFRTDVDFDNSNITNFKVESVLSLPTLSVSDSGRIVFDSGQNSFYGWTGTEWKKLHL